MMNYLHETRMSQVLEAIKHFDAHDQEMLQNALGNLKPETPGIIVKVDESEEEALSDQGLQDLIDKFVDLQLSLTADQGKLITSIFCEGYVQGSTIHLMYSPQFKGFLFPLH
ncbi:hypothetical protein F9B85_05740 [Heliorestis acidaminivorans]|uniref:Uncharacterized protein n=1 Tax=Heliorestis acidaminivorans TaxID=553427 RepID=A0A6I0ESC8_9FIRM|nr:hypothetical protein [Heliorestis acidaminivorans]KAB2953410.1 hypothetical protein F9B85_05740 [Heliorestis acidaminivorans]